MLCVGFIKSISVSANERIARLIDIRIDLSTAAPPSPYLSSWIGKNMTTCARKKPRNRILIADDSFFSFENAHTHKQRNRYGDYQRGDNKTDVPEHMDTPFVISSTTLYLITASTVNYYLKNEQQLFCRKVKTENDLTNLLKGLQYYRK